MDAQSEVLTALREAQTQNLRNVNDFMRQSIRSIAASEAQSLNESALAEAIADYIQKGGSTAPNESSQEGRPDADKLRTVGEELVIDKINRIFDSVQKEQAQPKANTVVDSSQ